MHPAIEYQLVTSNLQVVRVRADLGVAGEINEFQFALLLLLRRKRVSSWLFSNAGGEAADQAHQH